MMRSSRCRRGVGLSLCSLALLHARAEATEYVTTSGTLLRQNQVLVGPNAWSDRPASAIGGDTPAPVPDAAPEELAFLVNDVQLSGDATDAERTSIAALVEPIRGRRVTLSRLQALRGEINLALFQHGDAPVSVSLPPQTIDDGVVRFQVLHGHIEDVRVDNASSVSNTVLDTLFARRRTLRQIRRGIRLVQQMPGVGAVLAQMSEGSEQGGTLVTVSVAPGDTLAAGAVLDNAGSDGAGTVRVGLAGTFNEPTGRGDRLDAIAYATPKGLQSGRGRGETRLGRIGYETAVARGSARIGAAWSQVGYRLGGPFEGLGKGNARVSSAYAIVPALQAFGSALDVGLAIERRRLEDQRFGDLLESRRESNAVAVNVSGDAGDALQSKRMSLRYTGEVRNGRMRKEDVDRSTDVVDTQRGARNYIVVRLSADVLRAVTPNVALGARARAQWAGSALDGSERTSLGGPDAVRAYDQSAAAVDSGGVISLGASYAVPRVRAASIDLFYDYGRGSVRALGASPSEASALQGAGIGVNWQRNGFAAQIVHARPTGPADASRSGQTWFTIRKAF